MVRVVSRQKDTPNDCTGQTVVLLKVFLCSLKPPLRVLRACFVICNCFCHINYKAGVKITTAGRIITRQTPHSGLCVHHLQILHECADFIRLLKIIKAKIEERIQKQWEMFYVEMFCKSEQRHPPHAQLFSPRGLTMD